MTPAFSLSRQTFHHQLMESLLTVSAAGVPGNADGSNRTSIAIAAGIANRLSAGEGIRISAQTSGNRFEAVVAAFVRETFAQCGHLRPGSWEVFQVGGRSRATLSKFAQYAHLHPLQLAAKADPVLAASLGNDYTISPDVVVVRHPETDGQINRN